MKIFNKVILTAALAISGMTSAYADNGYFNPDYLLLNDAAAGQYTNTWSFGSITTAVAGTGFDEYFAFNVLETENISVAMVSVLAGGSYGVDFTGGGYALYDYSDGFLTQTLANNPIAVTGSLGVLTSGTYILEVAGSFVTNGGSYAGAIVGTPLAAAVPEPSRLLMLLAGLAAVTGVALRRKNKV